MAQKLSEKINRYFNLMEQIREQLFRVMAISDRYLCIVSFSTSTQSVMCDLISKQSLMPAKLLEGLTGAELVAYGTILSQVEVWVAGGMQGEYPLSQDKDIYAAYRKMTRDESEEQDEDEDDEDLDYQERDNVRTSILCADHAWLVGSYVEAQLGTREQACKLSFDELQEALSEHYGVSRDVDVTVVDTSEEDENDEEECQELPGVSWQSIASMPRAEALQSISRLQDEALRRVAQEAGVACNTTADSLRSLLKGRILNL